MAQSAFTIIVPVFEETEALEFARFYYQRLGLTPIFALDSKRQDRFAEVAKIVGRPPVIYNNPGHCIEAGYDQLAALSPTDWVLRVDCDEAPNTKMINYCARFVARPTDAYCSFDRDDLLWRETTFQRLKYKPLFVDSQFRLFNRRKVKFLPRIHTPGFDIPKWKVPFLPGWNAPASARLYHLQRTFITAQQRADKLARYNDQGQDQIFNTWLTRADDSFKWRSFNDATFTKLFAEWKAHRPL